MAFTVRAPNGAFNGDVGGIRFIDGVATVEKRSAIFAYFQRHGYRIEKVQPASTLADQPAATAADDDKPRRGGKAKS